MHCFTTPLLTDAAGTKFGKSEGNAVWLSADMTSPYAFYQYWINVEDASVVKLLKVFTDRTPEEIAELEKQVAEEPFRRTAQRTLAADVTTLVHGAEATAAVQAASEALFGKGDLAALDPRHARRRDGGAARAPRSLRGPRSSTPSWPSGSSTRATPRAARSGRAGPRSTTRSSPIPTRCWTEGDFLAGRVALLKRGRRNLAAARRA